MFEIDDQRIAMDDQTHRISDQSYCCGLSTESCFQLDWFAMDDWMFTISDWTY